MQGSFSQSFNLPFNLIDKLVISFDNALRAKSFVATKPSPTATTITTQEINEPQLLESERLQSIAMMRINHSGEVCAQALYQGQSLMARNPAQYQALLQAAAEECDHMRWCEQRLQELNGRTSLLNPLWYAGSFAIGAVAGLAGDKISLGFLAETEYQVTAHLDSHLQKMSENDRKSRAILEQMRNDELQHATNAQHNGAAELPRGIKRMMRYTAKILTFTAAKL